MKRILALLAALPVLVLLFVACTEVNAENPTADTTAPATTEPVSNDLEIVKDGVANYRIVRPEDGSEAMIKAASRLREMIGDKTGVNPTLGTDWTTFGAEPDHESLEILVGPTLYEESAQALEGVPYGDYVITRVGNKLVINAWVEEGITAAITALNRELVFNGSAGNFTLPQDIRLTGTKVAIVNELPIYAGGTLSKIYDAGDKSQVLVFADTDPEEYAAYRKALEAAGYTLYTENDITDNKFATYINDKYTVNVGYYAYETACRAVIEPRTTLQPLESDNGKYEKLVQPSVAMLGQEIPGNDGEDLQSGLCLIFQLADGSYIIVDGGYKKDVIAKDIYDYLYEHAPDKNNITIAAWLMTHGHTDHQGVLAQFSSTYASKVKLEMMIANYPSKEFLTASDPEYPAGEGDKLKTQTEKFKDAKFIRAHVGQEFYLRDARIEILFTLDSLTPDVLDNYNTISLIFTVELGGQKINVLGDADEKSCQIALKMFGDYLKADIVQMAHHGFGTGSSSYSGVTGVYDKSASPIVLWPVGMERGYAETGSRPYTKHLVNLETTKEIFVAGYRTVRLPLPYTVGTSGCESILK